MRQRCTPVRANLPAPVDLPFVSIVDATAERVAASGMRKVDLLGVKQTMAGSFYHERLAAYGIEVLTPSESEQDTIHDIVYRELVQNRLCDESRQVFVEIIHGLAEQGAQGCILGCTEIPLLIKAPDVEIPIFDTTRIHCEVAVARAFDPVSANFVPSRPESGSWRPV